jgi:hypothetical protein
LKNIGKGPAIAVFLFDAARDSPIGELDLVEPLGPRPAGPNGETERVGRRQFRLSGGSNLRTGITYRLLYQDIANRWHETRFTLSQNSDFTVWYLGPKGWWQRGRPIPKAARDRGQVVGLTDT